MKTTRVEEIRVMQPLPPRAYASKKQFAKAVQIRELFATPGRRKFVLQALQVVFVVKVEDEG